MKQALIEARKQVHDLSSHDTYNNTHAIIFFGTPHRGSNIASWGRLLSSIAQAAQMDTHDGILIDLDPKSHSSKLRELNLDFDDILCDSRKARQLRVFSFQEAQGMTGVNLLGGKVSLPSIAQNHPGLSSDTWAFMCPQEVDSLIEEKLQISLDSCHVT